MEKCGGKWSIDPIDLPSRISRKNSDNSLTCSRRMKSLNVKNRPRPICKICNRSFSKPANLRAHERIHTGEKRYECKICAKRFVWKSSLNFHHRRGHKNETDVPALKKNEETTRDGEIDVSEFNPSLQETAFAQSTSSDSYSGARLTPPNDPLTMATIEISLRELECIPEDSMKYDRSPSSSPKCLIDEAKESVSGFDMMEHISSNNWEPTQSNNFIMQASENNVQQYAARDSFATDILTSCEPETVTEYEECHKFIPTSESNDLSTSLLASWADTSFPLQSNISISSISNEAPMMFPLEADASSIIPLQCKIDEDPLEDVGELGDISEIF